MAKMDRQYAPGVCNIGRAEIGRRKLIGWIAVAITALSGAACFTLNAAPAWRLLLFFPATLAALGFLQAARHFCVRFGLGGVSKVGPNVGQTDTIEQAEYRNKDRRTALRIIGLSVLVGAVVAAAAYVTPL